MSAKFIVIEGLDGSGKATQTKILFDKISAMGKNINFPITQTKARHL